MSDTLAARWKAYEARIVPADASEGQRRDCRHCFYVGASSVFEMFMKQASLPNVTEESDDALCEGLNQEFLDFAIELAEFVKARQEGQP